MEETRRRIVDATLELHAERGISATRWDDIAARAGVGVGTVYRHFPSLDELVPACGQAVMERLRLPDPAAAEDLFAGADDAPERMERLVAEVFALYERGAPLLRTTLRESGVHPQVAHDAAAIDALLGALVDAALAPLSTGSVERQVVRAMVDLDTWTAFRANGLDDREAVEEVVAILGTRLGRT